MIHNSMKDNVQLFIPGKRILGLEEVTMSVILGIISEEKIVKLKLTTL